MGIIAGRVIQSRKRRGWTQGQLATYAKIHQSHLSRIESGKYVNVGSEYLSAIALALKTSADYLMGLTDDPRPLPVAMDNPIPSDVAEIAYRIQRHDHPVRERLVAQMLALLDMCDAVEEQLAQVKIIGEE